MNLPPGPFIVMGVSGCGKTTIASQLASRCGGVFLDADDFHPPENKAKMAAGIPLTDEDRAPWLETLNHTLRDAVESPTPTFLACSALRQRYRDVLARDLPTLQFIYLAGTKDEIRTRMEARAGHFMPPALLDSQFATLEEPTDALRVSIVQPPDAITTDILTRLTPG